MHESTIIANGVPLNVASGPENGPPLLLLHGVTRCWQDYWPLIPSLSAKYHLIAADFRGHGKSQRADPYFVTDYVADTLALLDALRFERCAIYGHSLGAMVAAAVAAESPQRISAIILEDPPFRTMGRNIGQTQFQALFEGMLRAVKLGGSTIEIAQRLGEIELSQANGGTIKLRDLRDADSLSFSASSLAKMDAKVLTPVIHGEWLTSYDEEIILKKIVCPTMLLQADETCSGAFTNRDRQRLSALLANSCCIAFQKCGHQIHLSQPERVLEHVHSFLSSLPI